MRGILGLAVVAMLPLPAGGGQTQTGFGAEEFGLTQRQLMWSMEQVEEPIAQDYERKLAATTFKFQDEVLDPVAEQIQQQLFSRKVQ